MKSGDLATTVCATAQVVACSNPVPRNSSVHFKSKIRIFRLDTVKHNRYTSTTKL